jgi:hypothetical protein
VRLEGQHRRASAAGAGALARRAHERLVPEVHAVEIADRDGHAALVRRTSVKSAD